MPIYKDTVKNEVIKPEISNDSTGEYIRTTDNKTDIPVKLPIGEAEIRKATDILQKYKTG